MKRISPVGPRLAAMGGELRQTLLLAAPITAGHVGQMVLGFVDTLMIGQVGVVPLAASAFGNAVAHFFIVIGIGLLSAVSVFVSHAHGAKKPREAGEMLRHGLSIALVSGGFISLFLIAGYPLFGLLGQPDEVIEACRPYLFYLALSVPFVLSGIAFKNYSEAQDVPWPPFWTGLLAVLLNIFLNWVLIYGNLGFPALGLEGAGIATLVSRIVQTALLIAWLRLDRRFRQSWPVRWPAPLAWTSLKAMLHLGAPVALQLLLEVGAFAASTLLMGWIGVTEMAAHQIALTYAATTFMIPLGISLAVAIRVGQVIGAGESTRSRAIGFGAIGFGILASGLFALVFILFNEPLVGIFSDDPATVALASTLIIIAGIFQLFDATQVLSIGALRGFKDVRVPTAIVFTAYWIIGIPIGAGLAFLTPLGAAGLWIGLAAGLGSAAVGLVLRFARITFGLSSAFALSHAPEHGKEGASEYHPH
jgi:MATE family multidrug resistance protein